MMQTGISFFRRFRKGARADADRQPHPMIEALEDRRLLSASVLHVAGSLRQGSSAATHVPARVRSHGVKLNLTAGQNFDGFVGQLTGINKHLTGLNFSASINWGDGTAHSAGTATLDSSGNIDVNGSHTYAKAGQFAIRIRITGTPITVPGKPTPKFVIIMGTIHSRAIVAPAVTTGGVTLHETAGMPFTASVGTFITIAPAANLRASIDWGDGSTSAGTLKTLRIIGVDQIEFEVDGMHTYAKPGTYSIHADVIQPGPTPTSPDRLVASIDSSAIVAARTTTTTLLNGTITGQYRLAPTNPDLGAMYVFSGSGKAGDLGDVTAQGSVRLPGFIILGKAGGTLTLTRTTTSAADAGSVTLTLTGPIEHGFGPFPSSLSYMITSGTGAFAGATGSGTIAVTLSNSSGMNDFTFAIKSLVPPAA